MKKILISTHSLKIGGIEKALLNLIYTLLSTKQYEVTLCLEKKEGEYLQMLPPAVKVITYEASSLAFGALRKTINLNKIGKTAYVLMIAISFIHKTLVVFFVFSFIFNFHKRFGIIIICIHLSASYY